MTYNLYLICYSLGLDIVSYSLFAISKQSDTEYMSSIRTHIPRGHLPQIASNAHGYDLYDVYDKIWIWARATNSTNLNPIRIQHSNMWWTACDQRWSNSRSLIAATAAAVHPFLPTHIQQQQQQLQPLANSKESQHENKGIIVGKKRGKVGHSGVRHQKQHLATTTASVAGKCSPADWTFHTFIYRSRLNTKQKNTHNISAQSYPIVGGFVSVCVCVLEGLRSRIFARYIYIHIYGCVYNINRKF